MCGHLIPSFKYIVKLRIASKQKKQYLKIILTREINKISFFKVVLYLFTVFRFRLDSIRIDWEITNLSHIENLIYIYVASLK